MQIQQTLKQTIMILVRAKCKVTDLHKLKNQYSNYIDKYLSDYIKDQQYVLQCQHCDIVKVKDSDKKLKTLDIDQLMDRLNVVQYRSKLSLVEDDENYLEEMLSNHTIYDYRYCSMNSILEKPTGIEVWVYVPNMYKYVVKHKIKENFDVVNSEIYHESELIEQDSLYL